MKKKKGGNQNNPSCTEVNQQRKTPGIPPEQFPD